MGGTKGLFGFFFRGKYYVFWSNYDSYFEGLGQLIVNELKECGILALFIRLLEHIVEMPVPEDSDARMRVQYAIQAVDAADVALCQASKGPLAQALSHGFDGGVLELCHLLDSPPDLKNVFVAYSYFVNLDEMKLHVYSERAQSRYFELSHTEQTIPDDWIKLLEEGSDIPIPYSNLPHPSYFLETAIAAMAERGYIFQRWISKRSIENVIGAFINQSTSEQIVAIKLYFGKSMIKEDENNLPCSFTMAGPSLGEQCRDREQAVAALLLESQAASADHPLSIVPIVEIIHRGPSAHDVAGVVMYLAPSDLDSHFEVIRTAAAEDRDITIDKTGEVAHIRKVLTQLKMWMSDLLLAVKWFRDRDLVLMDLKSGNVIVHENGHLMLCDFEAVCKQSPQCAAKLYHRSKVADGAMSAGGEGMAIAGDASVDETLPKAAKGRAKWESGWDPLKNSDLAPGFETEDGSATVLQDYFCLGALLYVVYAHAAYELSLPYFETMQRFVETGDDSPANAHVAHLIHFMHQFEELPVNLNLNSDLLLWTEVERLVHDQMTSMIDQALGKLEEELADA